VFAETFDAGNIARQEMNVEATPVHSTGLGTNGAFTCMAWRTGPDPTLLKPGLGITAARRAAQII
jgi:hypothetical protein